MALGFICTRCTKHLQNLLFCRTPKLMQISYPLIWNANALSRNEAGFSNANCKETLKTAATNFKSVYVPTEKPSQAVSHSTNQKPSVDHGPKAPNMYLSCDLETPSGSPLHFTDSLDIRDVFSVIAPHVNDLTPKDLCIAVNKLWESMWAARQDVCRLMEYSKVLEKHDVLPELCNMIAIHVHSMSNAEALNTLYLFLKFGVPEVTGTAIASLHHNLSLRISSLDLSDAAMFIRCFQSVKDVVPTCDLNYEEGRKVLHNVLLHLQDALIDDLEHQPQALSRLLLGLLHCNVEVTHPVIIQIVQKLYVSLSQLDSSHLSPLSKAIFMMNRHQSHFAGKMTARLSEILHDIASPSDFSHIFFTLIGLCSVDLEIRLSEAFMRLYVKGASYGFNDIRRIMQGANLMRNKENRNSIMTKAGELLIPQVPLIPPIELAIIYSNVRKVYSRNYELKELLEHQMEKLLLTCSAPHQLLALIEVLSYDPSPDLKPLLINKALIVVPHLSVDRLSRLCNAAGRMKVRSGKLPSVIEHHVLENIDKIFDLIVIKNISQYLATSRSSNVDLKSTFIDRLHDILRRAVSPGPIVFALDALSNLDVPFQDIDPSIWDKIRTFIPKLKGNDLRRVFFILSTYSNHLRPGSFDLPESLLTLLDYVRIPLQSPEELDSDTNVEQSVPSVEGSVLEQTMHSPQNNTTLDPSLIRDSSTAIAFAKILVQHRIYNQRFLARIESLVQSDMDDFSPFHVRDILEAFSCGNYQPSGQEFLVDLCASRVMPYVSDLKPQRMISIALRLAGLQIFPVHLLQTIFSLDFLECIEETYMTRSIAQQLQELNRAVCLECPELRVPWFSQEKPCILGKFPFHGLKMDIESALHDVLGGPAFLRRNALAPYAYMNDFECILDRHGHPVAYGSHSGSLGPNLHIHGSHLASDQGQHHGTSIPPDFQRVAMDVVPPSEMCSNIKRFSSRVEMKRRHLEILGYDYILIPHTDWNRDLLPNTRAKRLYISELFGGNLCVDIAATAGSEGIPGPGLRPSGRSNDMVERMLQEWGEEED